MSLRSHMNVPEVHEEEIAASLREVPLRHKDQNYAVVCVLARKGEASSVGNTFRSTEDGSDSDVRFYVNILGAFKTQQKAQAHIKSLHAAGFTHYDLHVTRCNVFAPYPPPRTDVVFQEKDLDGLMKTYVKASREASKNLEERVQKGREEDIERRKQRAKSAEPSDGASSSSSIEPMPKKTSSIEPMPRLGAGPRLKSFARMDPEALAALKAHVAKSDPEEAAKIK